MLAQVSEVLDHTKDDGEEEADPYVLAMACEVRAAHPDVRVVTKESQDHAGRMSLASAAGYLALPAVHLRAFLSFEDIVPFRS